jgi:hypothetical protein
MLHPTPLRIGDERRRLQRTPARISLAGQSAPSLLLARYLDGWVEANPAKIADATTDDYDFHDPLVGHFSRSTLPRYFMLLRSRFTLAGVSATGDLAFRLHGPMSSAAPHPARRQYWREAPHLGLTGIAELAVRDGRVVAEAVVYDLNMASETLRGGGPNRVGTGADDQGR